jgi:hypothetical protein
MIERQIEAPVVPGDDDDRFPVVSEAEAVLLAQTREGVYIEPGGLVDIAVNELGGQVTEVERLPDEEP